MGGTSKVLIGLQYGDEGKARVLDRILPGSEIVARFNGGANAGHTLQVGKKRIALHQVPSGIFYPQMLLYIGSGCVLSPEKLSLELEEISSNEIDLEGRLSISSKVTLIQPHQVESDKIHGQEIGTTGNGIGPAYADLALRMEGKNLKTLRLGDYLADPDQGKEIVCTNLKSLAEKHQLQINVEERAELFDFQVRKIKGYCCPDPLFLQRQVESGKKVFFEGAQSCMLDLVQGTYPCVTSSRTLASAAYTGGDLSLRYHAETIGVAKAIMSRVGNGPFISEFGGKRSELYCAEGQGRAHIKEREFQDYRPGELLQSKDLLEVGTALRMLGNEYGATTKRPRRIGMLDLVMLKQNCLINGVDKLYLNKFDSLADFRRTSLPGIPLVVAYELEGRTIDYLPTSIKEMERTKPVVEYFPNFPDLSGIRNPADLPPEAKELISFIEQKVGTKIAGIGVGPERDQFIEF